MEDWNPTHVMVTGQLVIPVMLDPSVGEGHAGDAAAYTKAEWDACIDADYCVNDGEWLFQGEPFNGEVLTVTT